MFFSGIFLNPLDKLLRATMPKTFRSQEMTQGGTLLVRQKGHYFIAAMQDSMRLLLEEIAPGPREDEVNREIRRIFMAGVQSVHVDPQGRFKATFMDALEEGSKLIFIGVGDEFEIWKARDLELEYPELMERITGNE